MGRLRIATYNLESLGGDRNDRPLDRRIAALAPILTDLRADILLLQEVNGDASPRHQPRRLDSLAALLAATPYSAFDLHCSGAQTDQPADRHNLAILSRWPLIGVQQWRNDLVAPPVWQPHSQLAGSAPTTLWDRPMLTASVDLPADCLGGRRLHLANLHLRAPLATALPGHKISAGRWADSAAWAEGYYLSAMKRAGQALEARLWAEQCFDRDPAALILVGGDLNSEPRETALALLQADPERTGNAALADRCLHALAASLPPDAQFSVRHRGRPVLLDHLLASPALATHLHSVTIANQDLPDEEITRVPPDTSFHAPVVVEFRTEATPSADEFGLLRQ